jgi:hypothetical protein
MKVPAVFLAGIFFIFCLRRGCRRGLLKQTSAGGFFLSRGWERWGYGIEPGFFAYVSKAPGLHPLRKHEHPDNKKIFKKNRRTPMVFQTNNKERWIWVGGKGESFGMRNCLHQVREIF